MSNPLFDYPLVESAYAWACSTEPEEPPTERYCPTRDMLSGRLSRCMSDAVQSGMPEQQSYLLRAMLGEIGNNAFDHNLGAWNDIPGALFHWEKSGDSFLACIADRGQGVRKTLQQVRPSITSHGEALKVAFLEQLSGRAPERRGNGLKFVRNILLEDGIDLLFHSGDARYIVVNRNERWEQAEVSVPGCLAVVSWKRP